MASPGFVIRVWIEEGCIVCDACETAAPDVFEVKDDTCTIRPEALRPDFVISRTQEIKDAAEECPVEVIKFETVDGDESGAMRTDHETQPAAPPADSSRTPVAADPEPPPTPEPMRVAQTPRQSAPGCCRPYSGSDRVSMPDPDPQRRSIVGGTALTIGWVAFGSGLGISVGPALARFLMPNAVDEPHSRVAAGDLRKYRAMRPGDVNEDYKPQGIWIVRGDDRLIALSTTCTHLGCIPNWIAAELKFKCPCHGSGFGPTGINFEGPAPRPLERFRVFVADGELIVDKSKTYRYELGQGDEPGSYVRI